MGTLVYPASSGLLQLAYCSRSRLSGGPEEVAHHLRRILHKSRQSNAAVGITGVLLYNGRAFSQVLEGPVQAVEETFERILNDPRHTSVVQVSRAALPRRLFPTWAMAYADAGTVRNLPESDIDLEAILAAAQSRPGFVLHMLRDVMATHDNL